MKRERRRNARIPVETPVTIQVNDGAGQMRAVSSDIGEGGMAIQLAHRPKNIGKVTLQFSLPGTEDNIECGGEVAWEIPDARSVSASRTWRRPCSTAERMAGKPRPEFEQDDPPAPCKLTDLSLGGCYLETASPFPVRTRIILSMKVAGVSFRAEGLVLVMHSDIGMGIEFSQDHRAPAQRPGKVYSGPDQDQWRPSRTSGGTRRSGNWRTGPRPICAGYR